MEDVAPRDSNVAGGTLDKEILHQEKLHQETFMADSAGGGNAAGNVVP